MREFARRGPAVLFAVLPVTTGASGPVSATLGPQDCNISDSAISAFINNLINPNGDECRSNPTDSTLGLDGTQDKVKPYPVISVEKTSLDLHNMATDNCLNDTESVARMEAQVAVAEAYGDGRTKEQARIDAGRAVANYYVVKQKNDITRWNVTVSVAKVGIGEHSESESISNSTFIMKDDFAQVDSGSGRSASKTHKDLNTSPVTLVNDSSVDVLVYNYIIRDGYNSANMYEVYYVTPARHEWLQMDGNFGWGLRGWEVAVLSNNYGSIAFIERQSLADRWARYKMENDDLQTEALNFVNATYDDFVAGNINSSDVISANTVMFEYGTQSGSDSTSLYGSTTALTLMGFDVPDMQSSRLTNVTDQSGMANVIYQGLVLVRSVPNGSQSVNTAYDASAIDGSVFIATVIGEKVDLDGTFIITEVTARGGSLVQLQNTTQYVCKTTSTSEFVSVTSELESLRQDIEKREQLSGGSGGSGGLDSRVLGVALLVGAATMLLIRRKGSEQDAPPVLEAAVHRNHRRRNRARWCSAARGH